MTKGRDILLEVLADEGVDRIFGNPGTTELPLVEALTDAGSIRYTLALQEATAVGMADGYAQVTGRPSFLSLHTSAGLGNAVGNLTNARANGSPMVVSAGQQDRRHLMADPLLGGDLVGLAAPVTKWAAEVTRVEDLGLLVRRAFHDADDWPRSPVFLSLPMDMLDEVTDAAVPGRPIVDRRTVPAAVADLAAALSSARPGELAIVVGDEVAASNAMDGAVALAEALGATVFATPLHATGVFAPGHYLFGGALPPSAAATRKLLAPFRSVFLVAGRGFMAYPYTDGSPLPESIDLLHLSPEPGQLGRVHPCRLGMVGDPAATIDALLPLIAELVDGGAVAAELARRRETHDVRDGALEEKARSRYSDTPVHPMAAVHAVVRALPPETPVVDEAVTSGPYVRGFHRYTRPNRYFSCRGGGLGWGMPAAVGVSLGLDSAPTVCVVGDGSAMYSPQALWSAARERVPVVFVILDNAEYLILKQSLRSMYDRPMTDRPVGLHLDDPPLDFCSLAASMGVGARHVGSADDLSHAVQSAIAGDAPALIHVTVGEIGG